MSSRTSVTLPSLRRAASRAAAGVRPRAMFSSISIARCASISRARSASQYARRKNRVQLMAFLVRLKPDTTYGVRLQADRRGGHTGPPLLLFWAEQARPLLLTQRHRRLEARG